MQLILLDKIKNLGNLGDTVKVKSGYGRNYLVPTGKAIYANAKNTALFAEKKAELENKANINFEQAKNRYKLIEELNESNAIVIKAHSADEGKLYGSVGAREICNAVNASGVELSKAEVLLPNGSIRTTGSHEVRLSLHTDIQVTLKFTIIAEE